MNYLYKRIYQVKGLCMLVLMICVIPINLYAVCSIQNEIETVIDGVVLDELIQGWQNNDLLNKYCYVSIGIKYFQFYRTTSNTEDLNHAIRYLEYAENNLREQDQPYYNNCYTYLLRAESFRVPPNIENILQYNQRISGTNTITDQQVLNNIRSAATQAANNYLRDPFHQNYPQTMMQNLADLGIPLGIADRISQINERITEFRRGLHLLQTNQTLSTIQSILNPITQLERMTFNMMNGQEMRINMTNIQTVSAIRDLQNYYNIYNNTNADDRCTQLGIALSSFERARNTFNYLDDTLQVGCHKGFICLSRDIQMDFNNNTLMPDHEHRNDYNNRLRRCQNYLTQYRDRIAQCYNVQITGDQRPKLNDIVAFYEAYNCLSSPPRGLSPTSRLEQFYSGIQNNNNEYARTLYWLAGFYIAKYYYQNSLALLRQGPGAFRDQTLNKIFHFNTRYYAYRRHMTLPEDAVDIFQQYQFLLNFFNQYHANPNGTDRILSQMNFQIRNAWGLSQLVSARLIEIQRQEEQNNINQPVNQPEGAHVADPLRDGPVDNILPQPSQQSLVQQQQHIEVNIPPQNIPGEEQRNQDLRKAQRAFNRADYIEAWRLYGNAYPNIIPRRLTDLYNSRGRYQNAGSAQIWTSINRNHRKRIEILCMIMNMRQQRDVRTYIRSIINERKGYTSTELIWHISEFDHGKEEIVSDTLFFSSFYHLLTGDSTNTQIIEMFLQAYNQLTNPLENYINQPKLRVQNKRGRIEFWLEKSWSNYLEPVKSNLWRTYSGQYPEIFGPILQIPGNDQIANNRLNQQNREGEDQQELPPAYVNGVSNNQHISTFETFAKAILQLTEPLTCDFLRQFYPRNRDSVVKDCMTRIINFTKNRIRNNEDRFRYYYALALIRRAGGDTLNWIENIAIAYCNIPEDPNQGQRQTKLKKELAEAKLSLNNKMVQMTGRVRRYLTMANLNNDWNNSKFIKLYLDFYNGPNYARSVLQSIKCIGGKTNISEKRNFLTKLLNTYLIETESEKKSEYTSIFQEFVNNEQCITRAERAIWLSRWFPN